MAQYQDLAETFVEQLTEEMMRTSTINQFIERV